jgi:hypothetical protein
MAVRRVQPGLAAERSARRDRTMDRPRPLFQERRQPRANRPHTPHFSWPLAEAAAVRHRVAKHGHRPDPIQLDGSAIVRAAEQALPYWP